MEHATKRRDVIEDRCMMKAVALRHSHGIWYLHTVLLCAFVADTTSVCNPVQQEIILMRLFEQSDTTSIYSHHKIICTVTFFTSKVLQKQPYTDKVFPGTKRKLCANFVDLPSSIFTVTSWESESL